MEMPGDMKISSASIGKEYPGSKCEENVNWFITDRGITVQDKCKAEFNVDLIQSKIQNKEHDHIYNNIFCIR